jgi:hypothetical protein
VRSEAAWGVAVSSPLLLSPATRFPGWRGVSFIPAAGSWRGSPSDSLFCHYGPALVRPREAQAAAILDHSRALPQRDGCVRPAFNRGAVGGECNVIVLNARDLLDEAVAVGLRLSAIIAARTRNRSALAGLAILLRADPCYSAPPPASPVGGAFHSFLIRPH